MRSHISLIDSLCVPRRNTSKCQNCINFSQKMSAKTPNSNSALIGKIKHSVKEGVFTEVNTDKYDYVEPFEKIKTSGG